MGRLAAEEPDLVGARVGNYELTAVLGRGGMGVVYRAEHALLERAVAIKVLRPEAASSAQHVRRFRQEAVAASAVTHDHIVRVDDVGAFDRGDRRHHYIVMELLDGRDVEAECIASEGGRLADPERAGSIVAVAADALAAAHARDIVHRDVKPENLFLTRRGARGDYVKVLDFGVARLLGDHAPGFKTRTGAVLGTPEYMSPEQANGHALDGRTDVYSLGVVLFRMLAGRAPFAGETFTLLAVRINHDPLPPIEAFRRDVPPGLARVLVEATRKTAADRPTMRELVALLLEADAAPRALAAEPSIVPPIRAHPADLDEEDTQIDPDPPGRRGGP